MHSLKRLGPLPRLQSVSINAKFSKVIHNKDLRLKIPDKRSSHNDRRGWFSSLTGFADGLWF